MTVSAAGSQSNSRAGARKEKSGTNSEALSSTTSELNVAQIERWASALGGAALAAYGVGRRSLPGALVAAGGGALIYRGATGHCPVYAAAGVSTADGADDTKTALGGPRGVNVELAATISRPAEELYAF